MDDRARLPSRPVSFWICAVWIVATSLWTNVESCTGIAADSVCTQKETCLCCMELMKSELGSVHDEGEESVFAFSEAIWFFSQYADPDRGCSNKTFDPRELLLLENNIRKVFETPVRVREAADEEFHTSSEFWSGLISTIRLAGLQWKWLESFVSSPDSRMLTAHMNMGIACSDLPEFSQFSVDVSTGQPKTWMVFKSCAVSQTDPTKICVVLNPAGVAHVCAGPSDSHYRENLGTTPIASFEWVRMLIMATTNAAEFLPVQFDLESYAQEDVSEAVRDFWSSYDGEPVAVANWTMGIMPPYAGWTWESQPELPTEESYFTLRVPEALQASWTADVLEAARIYNLEPAMRCVVIRPDYKKWSAIPCVTILTTEGIVECSCQKFGILSLAVVPVAKTAVVNTPSTTHSSSTSTPASSATSSPDIPLFDNSTIEVHLYVLGSTPVAFGAGLFCRNCTCKTLSTSLNVPDVVQLTPSTGGLLLTEWPHDGLNPLGSLADQWLDYQSVVVVSCTSTTSYMTATASVTIKWHPTPLIGEPQHDDTVQVVRLDLRESTAVGTVTEVSLEPKYGFPYPIEYRIDSDMMFPLYVDPVGRVVTNARLIRNSSTLTYIWDVLSGLTIAQVWIELTVTKEYVPPVFVGGNEVERMKCGEWLQLPVDGDEDTFVTVQGIASICVIASLNHDTAMVTVGAPQNGLCGDSFVVTLELHGSTGPGDTLQLEFFECGDSGSTDDTPTSASNTPGPSELTTLPSSPGTTSVGESQEPPENVLHHYANQTLYEDDPGTWIENAPHATLLVLQSLVNSSIPVSTEIVSDATEVVRIILSINSTVAGVAQEVLQDVFIKIIAIADGLLTLDVRDLTRNLQGSKGTPAASFLYQAIENIHYAFIPSNEAYWIAYPYVVVYVHTVEVNSSSRFEEFDFANGVVVHDQDVIDHKLSADFTRPLDEWPALFSTVSKLRFKEEALRAAFERFTGSLGDSSGVFSYSIMAMRRFSFGSHAEPDHLPIRRARRIGPLILGASFGVYDISPYTDLVTIRHTVDRLFQAQYPGRKKHECIFLDYDAARGIGAWSGAGCRVKDKISDWESGSSVDCVCDHLTPFTLLLDICGSLRGLDDGPNVTVLGYNIEATTVTTAGLSTSIVCCSMVLVHLLWKLWRKRIFWTPRNFVRVNFVVSLIASYSFFIASRYIPETEGEAGCLAMAALSHWLILVTFAWMALEGLRIWNSTRNFLTATIEVSSLPGDDYSRYRWKVGTLSYVVPFILPLFAILSHVMEDATEAFDGYAYGCKEKSCWLTPDHVVFLVTTFVLPATLIAATNILVLSYFVYETRKTRSRIGRTRRLPNGRSALNLFASTGLLGGLWLFGYFTLFECIGDGEKYTTAVLFMVFTSMQGVFVLYAHLRQIKFTLIQRLRTLAGRSTNKSAQLRSFGMSKMSSGLGTESNATLATRMSDMSFGSTSTMWRATGRPIAFPEPKPAPSTSCTEEPRHSSHAVADYDTHTLPTKRGQGPNARKRLSF